MILYALWHKTKCDFLHASYRKDAVCPVPQFYADASNATQGRVMYCKRHGYRIEDIQVIETEMMYKRTL